MQREIKAFYVFSGRECLPFYSTFDIYRKIYLGMHVKNGFTREIRGTNFQL